MIEIKKIMDKFVERIQSYINEKGWDITKFSEFVKIPRRTVNSWLLKQRTPRIDYIYHISDCLNVSIDFIVGKTDFEN